MRTRALQNVCLFRTLNRKFRWEVSWWRVCQTARISPGDFIPSEVVATPLDAGRYGTTVFWDPRVHVKLAPTDRDTESDGDISDEDEEEDEKEDHENDDEAEDAPFSEHEGGSHED